MNKKDKVNEAVEAAARRFKRRLRRDLNRQVEAMSKADIDVDDIEFTLPTSYIEDSVTYDADEQFSAASIAKSNQISERNLALFEIQNKRAIENTKTAKQIAAAVKRIADVLEGKE